MMITGIPDTAYDGAYLQVNINDTKEKVGIILNELNPELEEIDYTVKLLDPYTSPRGVTTHGAKVIFSSTELKRKTQENAKSFKNHANQFFQSIYVKNDETKLARNENFRLRKKARELRAACLDDATRNTIKIEKGVLKQGGVIIDKFDLNNQIFQ